MLEWNEVRCNVCKKAMRSDASMCPHCRTEVSAGELAKRKDELKQSVIGGMVVLVLACAGLAYCSSDGGNKEAAKPAVETAEEREDRLRAHCLSGWDGSMREMTAILKNEVLNDPDSYEHIETRTTPPDAKDQREGNTVFRAKNGFGGYVRSSVEFSFDDKTCAVLSWKLVE